MKSCVVALSLALFLAEAQHTPRCFLALITRDVSMLLAPSVPAVHDTTKILWVQFNPEKQLLTDESRIEIESTSLKFITPSGRMNIRGSYNRMTGCIVGGLGLGMDDKLDGGVILNSTSTYSITDVTMVGGHIFPMDAPLKPPFIGHLLKGKKKAGNVTATFEACYKYGRQQVADGVEWNNNGTFDFGGSEFECSAYVGDDIEPVNVGKTPTSRNFFSQIFEPIPYFGTTQERIPFGPDTVKPDKCRELAEAEKLPAKYVAHNVHLKKCFYATKGGIIPMHKDLVQGWSVMRVDLPRLDFTMFSDSLKCKKA